jgi:4-hydroxy-3-methylbut-2-en-1-yl diphosphate reductase
VKSCARYCGRVHHVQTETDLHPDWFADAGTVGITAGTSTPDDIIERVERRIREVTCAGDGVMTSGFQIE